MKLSAAMARRLEKDLIRRGCADLADKYLTQRRSAKPKSKRPSQIAKAVKEATKRAKWRDIRSLVIARVHRERQGLCEFLCGQPADDPHHIISGSGKKRLFEAPETVAGICRLCHRAYEKADIETLERAALWASSHGFGAALKEIRYRLSRGAR